MARRRDTTSQLRDELAALEEANRRRAGELGARIDAIEGHVTDAKAALLAHVEAEKARIAAMRARVEPAVAPLRERAAKLTGRVELYWALRTVAAGAPCCVLEFEEGEALMELLDKSTFGELFGVWDADLRACVRSRHGVAKGCDFEEVEWVTDGGLEWELSCSARRALERGALAFSTRAGALGLANGTRDRETIDAEDRMLYAFARVSVPVYVVAFAEHEAT